MEEKFLRPHLMIGATNLTILELDMGMTTRTWKPTTKIHEEKKPIHVMIASCQRYECPSWGHSRIGCKTPDSEVFGDDHWYILGETSLSHGRDSATYISRSLSALESWWYNVDGCQQQLCGNAIRRIDGCDRRCLQEQHRNHWSMGMGMVIVSSVYRSW